MMPARDSLKTVAALHSQAESGGRSSTFRVVVATLGAPGSGEWSITQTRTFTAAEAETLSAFLDESDVQVLIHVVPAGMTVARTATLPEMAGEESAGVVGGSGGAAVAEALGLVAEGELPAALPWYRRAAGVISPGRGGRDGGGGVIGLLTGWPERDEDTSTWRRTWIGPQVGVSEVAALAGLARAIGGVDRALTLDPASGGVGVLCIGERIVARVARLCSTDSGTTGNGLPALETAARETLAETARAAGVSVRDSFSMIGGRLLLDPEQANARIANAARDRAWLGSYGIAAGALALFAAPSPTVHGLVGLHLLEPKTRPPVLARVTEFLGRPGRAAVIIGACIAILLALPLGAAFARMRMLEKSVTDEAAMLERNVAAEKELAFYKLLRERRWPMTKLLADVAGAAPVGVVVETIEIGQGEGLTVRGKADTSELVTNFRENLGKTKIFTQVTTPSTNPGIEGVQFQLTAKIPAGAAVYAAPPIDDFGTRTLAERMYGDAARGHAGSRSSSRPERSTASRPDRNGRSNRSNTPAPGSSSSNIGPNAWPDTPRTPTPAAKGVPTIPPPLTDAQINAMNATTAMLEWGKRKQAASQSGLDDATKRRLTEEAEKAKARMTAARQQGGGA